MSWRPHPKGADTNPESPRCWGTCDSCGMIYNLEKFSWQRQWSGMQLINLRYLVCDECYDIPNEQFRTIILPPDPPPVFNTRPEPYTIDETDWRVTEDDEIRITQDDDKRVTQPSQYEAETEDPN